MTTAVDGVERAQLVRRTDPGKGTALVVHFNPASLEYTVANTVENKGSGSSKKQHVTQSTGKLAFQLIFDTTDTGQDVRVLTEQVARLMEPQKKIPPTVAFEWGVYSFEGILESFKETIDFFSALGVPLRSTLALTLAKQEKIFAPTDHGRSAAVSQQLALDPIEAAEVSASGGPAGVAAQGGDPRAARDVAALNRQESLRFPSGDSFVLGESVPLAPPAAFATGGNGGGNGTAGGSSTGGGAPAGGGASNGVSGGASSGGGAVFGSRASARVTAAEGAFAGLRAPAPERRLDRLRLDHLQPRPTTRSLGTDQGATFQPGGQASVQGPVSLRADVSGSARLVSRIQLDEDQP